MYYKLLSFPAIIARQCPGISYWPHVNVKPCSVDLRHLSVHCLVLYHYTRHSCSTCHWISWSEAALLRTVRLFNYHIC